MRDLNANRKTYHVFNIYNIIILMSSMFWKKKREARNEISTPCEIGSKCLWASYESAVLIFIAFDTITLGNRQSVINTIKLIFWNVELVHGLILAFEFHSYKNV